MTGVFIPESGDVVRTSRILRVVGLLFVFVSSARAQGRDPLGALEEMATAEKPQDLLKHLPASLETLVNRLPDAERAARLKRLSFSKGLQYFGMTLHRSEDGGAWQVTSGESKGVAQPRSALIAGLDALVPIEITYEDPPRKEVFLVGMHFEQGEWRVTDVDRWNGTDLESSIARKIDPAQENETNAIALLRSITQALSQYAMTYRGTGIPRTLVSLSGKQDDQPSLEHAKLLDPSFMAERIQQGGYEFHYLVISSGGANLWDVEFQLTAEPLGFGTSGVKSFFLDQTGVMRFTSENRQATEEDEPVPNEP
jgi:hypothetical protein